MPTEEAGFHPADITGTAWVPPPGEPQGQSNIASALGVFPQSTEGDAPKAPGGSPAKEPEEPSAPSTKQSSKAPDARDTYSAKVQELAEEAYAWALHQAKQNESFLEKLVTSGDPTDQRLATKLLARNDFGAKTIDQFKKNVLLKKAGTDPRDLAIARLEMEMHELKTGTKFQDWQTWKEKNAVTGKAESLADSIRAEYPQMPNADVLAFVRGKLDIAHVPTQKEQMGYASGGLSAVPEGDTPDINSPLARALLPRDTKKTTAFARQLMEKMRR